MSIMVVLRANVLFPIHVTIYISWKFFLSCICGKEIIMLNFLGIVKDKRSVMI
jgi:hypothetical protein